MESSENPELYKLKTYGTTTVEVVLIKPTNIDKFNWKDGNYLNYIFNLSIFDNKKIKLDNFANDLGLIFEADKKEHVDLETSIIGESENIMYEIMWDQNIEEKLENLNGIGKLLHLDNKHIYGNVLFLKTSLPCDNYSNFLINSKKNDIYDFLSQRANHIGVFYDNDEWKEEKWMGNIKDFLHELFDEDKYCNIEIEFLHHNLDIYYVKTDGNHGFNLTNLVDCKIDRCFITSKKTKDNWDNISLNQVNKIIDIAKKTKNFKIDLDNLKEERDELNRLIIKNKYRILYSYWKKMS